jgi:hypothetical protein
MLTKIKILQKHVTCSAEHFPSAQGKNSNIKTYIQIYKYTNNT